MTDRSVVHATFTLEHAYAASIARVFRAWADPAAKVRWFALHLDALSRGERSHGLAHDRRVLVWEFLGPYSLQIWSLRMLF